MNWTPAWRQNALTSLGWGWDFLPVMQLCTAVRVHYMACFYSSWCQKQAAEADEPLVFFGRAISMLAHNFKTNALSLYGPLVNKIICSSWCTSVFCWKGIFLQNYEYTNANSCLCGYPHYNRSIIKKLLNYFNVYLCFLSIPSGLYLWPTLSYVRANPTWPNLHTQLQLLSLFWWLTIAFLWPHKLNSVPL